MPKKNKRGRLVLTRKIGQSLTIVLEDGREVYVELHEIRKRACRIAVTAPNDIQVRRSELEPKTSTCRIVSRPPDPHTEAPCP